MYICYNVTTVFYPFRCMITNYPLPIFSDVLGIRCYICENERSNTYCTGEFNLKTCEQGMDTCQTIVSYSGKKGKSNFQITSNSKGTLINLPLNFVTSGNLIVMASDGLLKVGQVWFLHPPTSAAFTENCKLLLLN